MRPNEEHDLMPRAASPWPGSRYETRHRWQLDSARSLTDAAQGLRALADELTAAHAAGWWLVEPMRNGHLLAARASRRKRAQTEPVPLPSGPVAAPALRWRLRVVDEPPLPGDEVLRLDAAASRTSVLASTGRSLRQHSGPPIPVSLLEELTRQLSPDGLGRRLWGLAPARVGPSVDLVADGSALRMHALREGSLVRTVETLAFEHGADGATSLLVAAAAYQRLARAADAMAAAGGLLVCVDDGRLHISYGRS
jgi:hypothetical protein